MLSITFDRDSGLLFLHLEEEYQKGHWDEITGWTRYYRNLTQQAQPQQRRASLNVIIITIFLTQDPAGH